MIDFQIPLAGMNRASENLDRAASRIAAASASPQGDSVDLSAEAVALLSARNEFTANAKVVQTETEMSRSLLNIVA